MKYALILLLAISLLALEVSAAKKKVRRLKLKPKPTEALALEQELNEDRPSNTNEVEDDIKMLEKDEEYAKQQELVRENERAREDTPMNPELFNLVALPDVCAEVICGAGRVCIPNKENVAECVCISDCPIETEVRRKVCSNHNETWTSDCAVYQQRCWCDTGDERCRNEAYKHVHIEYYGECREMPECTEGEMADFPRRMRDWLFNIMRDLADRDELPAYYKQLEREAETNMTKRWANAAVWKWCDLDGQPHDRSVSRHELFPIRAPLMSLEHCIAPFLNSCDLDDNHRITLKEWAKCLELNEDDIEERCEAIDDDANTN